MLDTESNLVHFFKKENATHPYKTRTLRNGILKTDKANAPRVMDRKTNTQRQTFRVQFMRSDAKTAKDPLYVVPQNEDEEEIMKLAFEKGVN